MKIDRITISLDGGTLSPLHCFPMNVKPFWQISLVFCGLGADILLDGGSEASPLFMLVPSGSFLGCLLPSETIAYYFHFFLGIDSRLHYMEHLHST